jgi:regulator of protease activity HflC (stomatin/prohibitin superfamily)
MQSPHSDVNASPSPSVTGWRRFSTLLLSTGIFHPDEWPVKRIVGTAVGIAVILIFIAVARHGVAYVRATEVGVLADNLRGELILKERIGYHVFVPYLATFYELDKTIQKLELTWNQAAGGVGRDVKLKTADGNNVSLDIVINFKLISSNAVEVLRRCGTGLRFSEILVEPIARHTCFASFSQLTTEEMYDAAKRNACVQAVMDKMNERLKPNGIEIVAVIPGEFRFYREYEQVIQDKKLADQQVEEQQAQARAWQEDQERMLIEANKSAEAKLAGFQGECANQIIKAEAEAAKQKREADGSYAAKILMADSALYAATREAEGRKATLMAEAEGKEQMRQAMTGDGGLSMVSYEYAKRLNKIHFSGTAITRDPSIQQLSVQPAAAVSAQPSMSGPPLSSAFGQPVQPPAGTAQPFTMQPNFSESK